MRLFSNRSQRTSKCGKNISDTLGHRLLCYFFVFTTFWYHLWSITEQTHGSVHSMYQETITRSLQLPHIPVTVFSQTDLFLVRIYLEFWSPWESQWPTAVTSTDCHVHVSPHCFTLTEARNLPISRRKRSKNRLVCENAAVLDGSCRLLVMGSWMFLLIFHSLSNINHSTDTDGCPVQQMSKWMLWNTTLSSWRNVSRDLWRNKGTIYLLLPAYVHRKILWNL